MIPLRQAWRSLINAALIKQIITNQSKRVKNLEKVYMEIK